MTTLRQRMDDAMVLRGFALRTRESYLAAVAALARHYHRSPDLLTSEDVQAWLLQLIVERCYCERSDSIDPVFFAAPECFALDIPSLVYT